MMTLRFAEEENISVEQRKQSLRTYMKERRANNENRDVKERLMIENLLSVLVSLQGQRTGAGVKRNVLVYLSFSLEASTDGLIERLQETGYTVFCPRVEDGAIFPVLYGEDCTLSAYGIREPVGEAFEGQMDFCVTPFLAVDGQGNRLGYGGGYYDRYFWGNPNVLRIAYGFDFQVLHGVPTSATDEKIDCIVTDKRVLYTGERTDER